MNDDLASAPSSFIVPRSSFRKVSKYAPVLFFIGGFVWDALTLGVTIKSTDLRAGAPLPEHQHVLVLPRHAKQNVVPGRWRVTAEAESGAAIGIVQFRLVNGEAGKLKTLKL